MHLRHVFVARHGETDWNLAGRWQGHTDIPLNATGRAQAVALADGLRGRGIEAIAASDLSRARHTAEIVGRTLGIPVALVDPHLREQRFGCFEGLTPKECEERYPADWARYVADPHAGPPGGESRAALLERVVHAVQGAAALLPCPALLVTHGGAIRALLSALPPAPEAAARVPGKVPNGGVVRVTLAAGQPVEAMWLGLRPQGTSLA